MPGTSAISTIAAMLTPALFILASSSLVGSVLTRMARVVDRVRSISVALHGGRGAGVGAGDELLREWLARYAARARYGERAIGALYASVVVFVTTCLSITLDRTVGGTLFWLPVSLAIFGTLLLLAGGGWMLAESRLSSRQIQDEIRHALDKVDGAAPIEPVRSPRTVP